MNAMSLLNTPLAKTNQFCAEHSVLMVVMGGNIICPECAKTLVKKTNELHQKQVDQMVKAKHFSGAMLPLRHQNSGFKNFFICSDNPSQANALKESVSFSRRMMAKQICNFVMCGSTGTGKTHLSCATARTLLNHGLKVRYITSEDLVNDIAEARYRPDDNEPCAIRRYSEYDLLIVDEYGLHDRESWRLEKVHKVLYSRYDANKASMIVSNLTLQELKNDLGDRLWSRLNHGGLASIECNWADARLGGGM